jgi:hypothetical protein
VEAPSQWDASAWGIAWTVALGGPSLWFALFAKRAAEKAVLSLGTIQLAGALSRLQIAALEVDHAASRSASRTSIDSALRGWRRAAAELRASAIPKGADAEAVKTLLKSVQVIAGLIRAYELDVGSGMPVKQALAGLLSPMQDATDAALEIQLSIERTKGATS